MLSKISFTKVKTSKQNFFPNKTPFIEAKIEAKVPKVQ